MADRHLYGHRLGTLRKMHGFTQGVMAERLQIQQPLVSSIERGRAQLTPAVADAASKAFGEPLTFFEVPPSAVPFGPPAFRKLASASSAQQSAAIETYQEASRVFADVAERSGYHSMTFNDVHGLSGADVARAVREQIGLKGDAPVPNAIRAFERLGIGVVTELLDGHVGSRPDEVSGLTMPSPANRRPLVSTLSIARGDVQRLTIAHEVGHVLMDRHAPTISCKRNSPEEARAFEFASEFLLPGHVVLRRISGSSTLRDFLALKADYGVSAKAIIYRARALGAISPDRHRTLSIQHSSRGWNVDEPGEVAAERPILFGQALAMVYPSQTYARASHELGVAPGRLRRWASATGGSESLAPVTSLAARRR